MALEVMVHPRLLDFTERFLRTSKKMPSYLRRLPLELRFHCGPVKWRLGCGSVWTEICSVLGCFWFDVSTVFRSNIQGDWQWHRGVNSGWNCPQKDTFQFLNVFFLVFARKLRKNFRLPSINCFTYRGRKHAATYCGRSILVLTASSHWNWGER